jgi:hypothetical protein
VAGLVLGAALGAGVFYLIVGPNPPGLEALGVLVYGLLGAVALSWPGAVLGGWLAVRGRPDAGRHVVVVALAYPPIVAAAWFWGLGIT